MASPQAPNKQRYQFIPRVLVFLTRGDDVLLIKRSPDRPVFPNMYNGLGGHVEKGETPLDTARREVLEEAGLQATGLWLCATVAIDTGEADAGIAMWVFRGTAEGQPTSSPEGQISWVPLAGALQLPLVEDIPTLWPKVMAMQLGDDPLWGMYTYDDEGKLEIRFED